MSNTTLSPSLELLSDQGSPITFTFEGRTIPARLGQSVAAALYATGVRVFTRSFKYHRPRGLFCVSGDCPNCLMNVDGQPNVRTCIEPARQGIVVSSQNAWPSLEFDALRVFDKLDRLLPVGFYYKRFHRPAWLWPIFEHTVRHIAGLGHIETNAVPDGEVEVDHRHTDVCVIGAGPSGLAAVAAARKGGAHVLLIERQFGLGGHLAYAGELEGLLRQLEAEAGEGPGQLELCLGSSVFGLYEGNLIAAASAGSLLKVRARQIVVATGGRQQPFVFHNNDLPGIMLGNGVLRLARLHGVRAGQRAVILTDCDDGHSLAELLQRFGIEVACVVDQRPVAPQQANCSFLTSAPVLRARGNKRLRAVRIGRMKANGSVEAGSEQEIACDLLCLASGLVPANELLLMAGMRFRQENRSWLLDKVVLCIHAAGAAAGTFRLDEQIREGRLCGATAAALALGRAPPPCDVASPLPGRAIAVSPRQPGYEKRFVCFCEDVTEKDIEQAVAEGFDHIETMKRYTTVNMGPCQGKMCGLAAAELCARLTGRDRNTVGLTTSRPPVVPVEIGVLATDRQHHPVRRTPLHHWHERNGALWMDAGQWKRPESYSDPVAEVRAVRNGVGLIDVGTLGKIEVIGPDAAELLERVYLNKWAELKPGRVRYGVMCNEDGILFDDGVGARLATDRFYLTATTGN